MKYVAQVKCKLCPSGTSRCRSATKSNISVIKMAGFHEKPAIFVSLRGRIAAVAIFKPKGWHPGTKYGSRKRQNSEILIRPTGTPHRRFSGSAISRGASPALYLLVFPLKYTEYSCDFQTSIWNKIPRRPLLRLNQRFPNFTARPCRGTRRFP